MEPRFAFGKNWLQYLDDVDETRVQRAVSSLQQMLNATNLEGQTFLDIGCGSGLFSLAAARLGARVHSFDYDTASVEAARTLKSRFAAANEDWRIERGDILDDAYIAALGNYDVVYSWGVLHHTGALVTAVHNACALVSQDGVLFIAIYNDQGWQSRIWAAIKRRYVAGGTAIRAVLVALSTMVLWGPRTVMDLARGRPGARWRNYDPLRGMSPWRDLIDWVGGWPFEVARPEQVRHWLADEGFVVVRQSLVGSRLGCNEYVARRDQ